MTTDIRKLEIGPGAHRADGWHRWDIQDGHDARRLDGIADGQLDAIKASHVLEHVSHRETVGVLREWSRALRKGGDLFVAVPDFDKCVSAYVNGDGAPVEAYVMGGHVDEHDRHGAIFNRRKLAEALAAAGFDVVGDWAGDANTCAALPVSLNIHARKAGRVRLPIDTMPDVHAVMSMPRLAWTENMSCCFEAFGRLGVPFVRAIGVFWGQCLQRLFANIVNDSRYKWIVAVDYDSIYDAHDIVALRDIAERNDLDVLAPLQIARDRNKVLTMIRGADGKPAAEIPADWLNREHWPVLSAHFGLTLISTDALRRMPLPWFLGHPGAKGDWGNDRVDDDIHFWHVAERAGLRMSITPRVSIGHLQLVATWPNPADLSPIHQYMPDFHREGRPE